MSWKYFKIEEFDCPCGCGRNEMKKEFIDQLDKLRGDIMTPFIISSGYRCPEYNAKISKTGKAGPHTTGQAVDIAILGAMAYSLLFFASQYDFTGIGINQKGKKRFIHLDNLGATEKRPRPWVWSY